LTLNKDSGHLPEVRISFRDIMMAKKRDIHVVPHPEKGWATIREGSKRVGSTHQTQADAGEAARDRARLDKVEVVTHGRDGRIRDSDSYGNDPHPPKDKKH
jgi:Uncharacterized protein conserved in bacteria (DUF2188)